jgi:16S rRNA (guanine527-N7)-methyltransferase
MVYINFLILLNLNKNLGSFLSKNTFIQKKMPFIFTQMNLFNSLENYKTLLKRNKNIFYVSEHVFLRNTYNNIISKQTTNVIYKKHILDSLSLAPFFRSFWYTKKERTCLDFGTGGGFPGLVLSVFFPQIFISLLDSIEKKNTFHIGILNIIKSDNCNSICFRGEKLGHSINHQEKYDLVLSRAVADLNLLIYLSITLLNTKGKFTAMKKINGCGKEINGTMVFFSKPNIKLKCLVKIDNEKMGKVLVVVKKL